MADSRIVRILEAIATKVEANYTLGYSAIDLSGKVLTGFVSEPPYVPFAAVTFVDYSTEHGPTLGRYRSRARFEIYLYCGGDTPTSRVKRAMNLTSDVINNITANRFLGLDAGTIDDVLCNFTAVDGQNYGIDNVGIGYIEVSTPFQSDGGV